MMLADILGMTSQDVKELFIFIGGVVVVYFQYKNNQLAHDAKIEAKAAVTEARDSRADVIAKLVTVENHIDGKMTLLLTEHGIISRQEGREEGRSQAKSDAAETRNILADAATKIAKPTTEAITEVKELVKETKEEVKEVPDKVVEKIKPD